MLVLRTKSQSGSWTIWEEYFETAAICMEWEKFPADCAGYRRSTVRTYAPALTDYSVTCQSDGSMLRNTATLYFYPRMKDAAVQLRSEVSEVLNAHQDGHIVNRREIDVEAKGKKYSATLITFEFTDRIAEYRQSFSSQLLMVFLDTGTFKVRSTSLVEQAVEAEAAVRQLLSWSA
jgi:hypothetical protein